MQLTQTLCMRFVRQPCIVHTNKVPQTGCRKHPAGSGVALEAGYFNSTGVIHPSEALPEIRGTKSLTKLH